MPRSVRPRRAGGKELTAAHATGYDYTRTGKPDIAWDDEEARNALVSALVTGAIALLAAVDPDTLDGKAADAYALFALVAGQDVESADGSDGTDGRWRIARKVAPDLVISTVDTDARHAHRTREARRDGYKAHIVIESDTCLVTAAALTKAAGQGATDAEAGAVLLGQDPTITTEVQVLADSAGHTALIKPKPLATAVKGGFTIDDFTLMTRPGR